MTSPLLSREHLTDTPSSYTDTSPFSNSRSHRRSTDRKQTKSFWSFLPGLGGGSSSSGSSASDDDATDDGFEPNSPANHLKVKLAETHFDTEKVDQQRRGYESFGGDGYVSPGRRTNYPPTDFLRADTTGRRNTPTSRLVYFILASVVLTLLGLLAFFFIPREASFSVHTIRFDSLKVCSANRSIELPVFNSYLVSNPNYAALVVHSMDLKYFISIPPPTPGPNSKLGYAATTYQLQGTADPASGTRTFSFANALTPPRRRLSARAPTAPTNAPPTAPTAPPTTPPSNPIPTTSTQEMGAATYESDRTYSARSVDGDYAVFQPFNFVIEKDTDWDDFFYVYNTSCNSEDGMYQLSSSGYASVSFLSFDSKIDVPLLIQHHTSCSEPIDQC